MKSCRRGRAAEGCCVPFKAHRNPSVVLARVLVSVSEEHRLLNRRGSCAAGGRLRRGSAGGSGTMDCEKRRGRTREGHQRPCGL